MHLSKQKLVFQAWNDFNNLNNDIISLFTWLICNTACNLVDVHVPTRAFGGIATIIHIHEENRIL